MLKRPSIPNAMLKLDVAARDHGLLVRDPKSSALMMVKDGQRCWVHVPPDAKCKPLPLLIVLHGAGKNKYWNLEQQAASLSELASHHKIIVVYPEARGSTWDYISSKKSSRADFDFIQIALGNLLQAYSVDRIGVMGLSDGGSMALSLAAANPAVFQAAISVSAGFCVEPPRVSAAAAAPKLFMIHGSHDRMFPLERVGLPLRNRLVDLGYDVEHHIAHGQGHVPEGWRSEFLPAWLAMGPRRR